MAIKQPTEEDIINLDYYTLHKPLHGTCKKKGRKKTTEKHLGDEMLKEKAQARAMGLS